MKAEHATWETGWSSPRATKEEGQGQVMDSEIAQALAERLGETIVEFAEANAMQVSDVLAALEFNYACVERSHVHTELPHKMH
jgi:hypothetical protein